MIAVFTVLILCSCGKDSNTGLSEVDIKKDLSVHITYRQISYNSIISYKSGVMYIDILSNGKFPDGLSCEVNKSGIIINYIDMKKSYEYESMPDIFMPKILYEFFSLCGDLFVTEEVTEKGSFIERNVCGKSVRFRVNMENGKETYLIEIK